MDDKDKKDEKVEDKKEDSPPKEEQVFLDECAG